MSVPRIILKNNVNRHYQTPNRIRESNEHKSWNNAPTNVPTNVPISPISHLTNKDDMGFEIGSIYKCLETFEHRFTTFNKNEILEVIGNRRPAKSWDTEIIFVHYQNRQKKFYTLEANSGIEKTKQLFERLN